MYLTVQRVASSRGERGINGGLYRHGAHREDPGWAPPNLDNVVNENLGELCESRTDVRRGGNAVECFLDIVCPDDVSLDELEQFLDRFRDQLDGPRSRVEERVFAGEFSQNLGEGARLRENFDQLRFAALELFQRDPARAEPPTAPVDIIATRDEEGWHFELTEQSRRRLADRVLARVSVPHDVAADFQTMYGELYPFVAEWVTHASRDELSRWGGVRILLDNEDVWHWPDNE